ncbi:MAG TPA: biopolymer transporter ExbD [Bacteroidales bacterium]|nr:biopolymer transporter ExbD [Bacteroidales bacterium]
MAEIIESSGSGKKEGGRRVPKKMGAHIDMTPMVDLMCLLITFFMLTTAFSKPKVMEITMPEKDTQVDEKNAPKVAADRTYSILLTADDKVYWYWHGDVAEGQTFPATINKTDFSKDGLRKILLKKNEKVFTEIFELKEKVKKGELVMIDDSLNAQIKRIKKSDKKAPIILIKADEKTKYKSIVSVVDEMAICNIANYAIVDIAPEEVALIEKAPK